MSRFILTGFSDEISSDFTEQLTQVRKLNIGYIEIRGREREKTSPATRWKRLRALKRQFGTRRGWKVIRRRFAAGQDPDNRPVRAAFRAFFATRWK